MSHAWLLLDKNVCAGDRDVIIYYLKIVHMF